MGNFRQGEKLPIRLTTNFGGLCRMQLMSRTLTRPRKPDHSSGFKLHYVPEWALRRGMKQADVARELAVNKATVHKWFKGALPSEENLPRIAALFTVEIDELFRAPGDNWLNNFLRNRSEEEQNRIKKTLEAAFPRRTGTDG
jgi:DNA-binding XRE family transcriptional regulator